jgi:hypothetical protein
LLLPLLLLLLMTPTIPHHVGRGVDHTTATAAFPAAAATANTTAAADNSGVCHDVWHHVNTIQARRLRRQRFYGRLR